MIKEKVEYQWGGRGTHFSGWSFIMRSKRGMRRLSFWLILHHETNEGDEAPTFLVDLVSWDQWGGWGTHLSGWSYIMRPMRETRHLSFWLILHHEIICIGGRGTYPSGWSCIMRPMRGTRHLPIWLILHHETNEGDEGPIVLVDPTPWDHMYRGTRHLSFWLILHHEITEGDETPIILVDLNHETNEGHEAPIFLIDPNHETNEGFVAPIFLVDPTSWD